MSAIVSVVTAQVRECFGKSSAKSLRKNACIPGTIYLENGKLVHVSLGVKEINKAVADYRFLNTVMEIACNEKKYSVLPKQIDFHPVTEAILHIEFKELPKKGNINVLVPVSVINQSKSVGIKSGGKLNSPTRNILVNCNPSKIPEKIVIDIEQYGIGRALFAHSIKTDGTYSFPENTFVLSILGRGKKDKAEEENTASAAEPEAAKQPVKN